MKTLDEQFEYGYIKHPRQMYGTMTPFRPHFWVQHLPSGELNISNTRQGVFQWIKGWYDICDSKQPTWLSKEIKQK
jgi:hypothetical protein